MTDCQNIYYKKGLTTLIAIIAHPYMVRSVYSFFKQALVTDRYSVSADPKSPGIRVRMVLELTVVHSECKLAPL